MYYNYFFGELAFNIIVAPLVGLDPAATLFIGYGNDIHLNKDDADYVDVIHTTSGSNLMSGSVGITDPIGHVDYFPNGGINQVGCRKSTVTKSIKTFSLSYNQELI